METAEQKKKLREAYNVKSKYYTSEDLENKSNQIIAHIETHPLYIQNNTLAFYSSLPHEVSLKKLFSEATASKKNTVFPKYEGDRKISFYTVTKEEDLEPGAFGVREPNSRCTGVSIPAIDIFFVPGISFDIFGNRLGSGIGCYDEALKQARHDAVFIGVASSFQIFPNRLPTSDHDILMHYVATEEGVVKVRMNG